MVVIGVLNSEAPFPTPSPEVLQHMSLWWFLDVLPPLLNLAGSSPAPGALPGLAFGPLGKAPVSKGGKAPPTARAVGFTSPAPGFKPPPPGASVGFQPSGTFPYLPLGKGHAAPPPSPQPGPSQGATQASLMNALAWLSHVLNRLRTLVDPLPCPSHWNPPTINSPWNSMQHQEQWKKQEDQESESGDNPARGLGRWFKVVKSKKNMRFENLGSPCF